MSHIRTKSIKIKISDNNKNLLFNELNNLSNKCDYYTNLINHLENNIKINNNINNIKLIKKQIEALTILYKDTKYIYDSKYYYYYCVIY